MPGQKNLCAFLTLAMTATLFAGCSGNSDSSDSTSSVATKDSTLSDKTLKVAVIVMFFGIYYSKGLYTFKICIRDILSCVVGCVFIGFVCVLVKSFFSNYFIIIAVSVLTAVICYSTTLIVMKNRLATTFLNTLKKKFQ